MQPETHPSKPADGTDFVSPLDELENLLKVKSPGTDPQWFWSEAWSPPELRRPEPEPEYHGGPWADPVNLAEAFGRSTDDEWAYAKADSKPAEAPMSDESDTNSRADQAPDSSS